MLRVVALVVAWAIPALLEDAVGAALGHARRHELVRRRARRKAEAERWCLHRRGSSAAQGHLELARWAQIWWIHHVCDQRERSHWPSAGLFAFAVRAGTQPVRVPGAALIVAPLHLTAVDRTPARVGVSGGLHLRGAGRWGPVGLRLHGGRYGRGDLLVERPGLGLALLLGLLAAALSLLLAGGQVGFAGHHDVLEPGQAHGGPPLELQVVHVTHRIHQLHVTDLELDVERRGRFA